MRRWWDDGPFEPLLFGKALKGNEVNMLFFRKKMPIEAVAALSAEIISDTCLKYLSLVEHRLRSDYGITLTYFQHDIDNFLELWLKCLFHLSKARQHAEGFRVAQRIARMFHEGENGPLTPEEEFVHIQRLIIARDIFESFPNDKFIFHNITCAIFHKSFPETKDYIVPFPYESANKIQVSGVELAAGLRAIDFVLKTYKPV
jgi:hypothetical protein